MIYRLRFTGPPLRTSVDRLPRALKCTTSLRPVLLLFLGGKNKQPVLRRTFSPAMWHFLCTPSLSASARPYVSYVMFNRSLTIEINWTALVPLWTWLFIISVCSIYLRNRDSELGMASRTSWQSSICVAFVFVKAQEQHVHRSLKSVKVSKSTASG